METKILNQISYYKNLIHKVYKINIEIESIKFDIKGNNAGQAITSYGKYFLRFNPTIYSNNNNDFLKIVIPHELAHLVIYELIRLGIVKKSVKGHGKEWKEVMNNLGIIPVVKHNFNIAQTSLQKFEYKCSCKTHFLTKQRHNKILNGVHYLCKSCRERLEFVNPVTFI